MPHGTCPPNPYLALLWTYDRLREMTLNPQATELADELEPVIEKLKLEREDTPVQ
jgi:hypothetical protein